MSKLLAVGTVAFDAIETPFGKTDKILGGSGTFVGLAASQFGVKTGVVSVVGGDFPISYIEMMESKGINTAGIEIVKEGKTFFWSGKYHNDMNSRDTLITELNVLETFTPVVPENFKDSSGREEKKVPKRFHAELQKVKKQGGTVPRLSNYFSHVFGESK